MPEELSSHDLELQPTRSDSADPVFRDQRVPAFLNDAMRPVEAGLEEAATRVAGLLRWRCNRTGPVDIPLLGSLRWSLDGASWKLDVRRPQTWRAEFGPDLVVSETRRSDLEKMIADGRHEPLHQSLLREADSLRGTNPRSALVIGVTAAEVAVKALVSQLAPGTSWLVQNLPSPPIAKILEEYLPTLLTEGSPPFAADLLKGIKSAVGLRNELVHGARGAVDTSRLSSAFRALTDLVWLCDYFAGAPWALNRVDRDTLAAMGLTPTVDTRGWFVD